MAQTVGTSSSIKTWRSIRNSLLLSSHGLLDLDPGLGHDRHLRTVLLAFYQGSPGVRPYGHIQFFLPNV